MKTSPKAVPVIACTTINGRESRHYARPYGDMYVVSRRVFRKIEARAGMGYIEFRLAGEQADEYGEFRGVSVVCEEN